MAGFEPWSRERGAEIIARESVREGATLPILHALQDLFDRFSFIKNRYDHGQPKLLGIGSHAASSVSKTAMSTAGDFGKSVRIVR